MSRVRTTRGSADDQPRTRRRKNKAASVSSYRLPTEYTEPIDDFNQISTLIHGGKKIGKTTLAQQCEGKVLLIQFDREQKSYRRLEEPISTWQQFRIVLKALERAAENPETFPYTRVVVDGADVWYSQCQEWVCEKFAIEHPSEESWGKAWTKLTDTFTDAVLRMEKLPCGRWYICHSEWVEHTNHDGDKVQRLEPKLPSRAEEILNGRVDLWMAYDYVKDRRVLFVAGSEQIGAGHSLDDDTSGSYHFRTPDGKKLKLIRAGNSADTAYKRLTQAYDNEYVPPEKDGKGKKT